jgi:hypothetical protein
MEFYKATRDLVSDAAVSRRFRHLQGDTLVAIARVSKDTHFVAFVQEGEAYVFPEVPAAVFTLFFNRLSLVRDPKPTNKLLTACEGIEEFDPSKPGKFVSYTSKETAVFPAKRGLVRTRDGKQRECVIVGAPVENDKGTIVLMLDQTIIFYPD